MVERFALPGVKAAPIKTAKPVKKAAANPAAQPVAKKKARS